MFPFILIEPDTPIHWPDVYEIVKHLQTAQPESGVPSREDLLEAVRHPNTAVREAARLMLEAMDFKKVQETP